MFYVGTIGQQKYDNDFQYTMSFSIRMAEGIPTLCVSLCTTHFHFFPGV